MTVPDRSVRSESWTVLVFIFYFSAAKIRRLEDQHKLQKSPKNEKDAEEAKPVVCRIPSYVVMVAWHSAYFQRFEGPEGRPSMRHAMAHWHFSLFDFPFCRRGFFLTYRLHALFCWPGHVIGLKNSRRTHLLLK